MNHIEATQYIKATLAAFGPGEAINMTQDTWTKFHEAMSVLIEQPAQQEPVAWYDSNTGWTDFHPFKPARKPSAPDAEWLPLYTTSPQPGEKNQEPVLWMMPDGKTVNKWGLQFYSNVVGTPLYTSPPAQRPWVGLTDRERNDLWREIVGWGDPSHDDEDLMKAIEDAVRRKNAT
jgi:hypothetical protein